MLPHDGLDVREHVIKVPLDAAFIAAGQKVLIYTEN
jgi:hypothetical protein